MESANLHEEEYHHHQRQQQQQQQQLQDELALGSSNSSLSSPCFSIGSTNHHAWRPPNFLLNNNNIHATCEEEAAASNSLTNSMIQNMGFAWTDTSNIHDNHQQSLISSKIIKQESSSTSCSSDQHHRHNNPASSSTFLADMLSPSTASASELLLLNTLSPNYKHPMIENQELLQFSALHQGRNKGVTTNFSQILPSVNISNLSSSNNNNKNDNNTSVSELVSSSSTMEMNHDLEGSLDVFATTRLLSGGNLISQGGVAPSNSHLLELFKFEHHHHHLAQQSNDLKLWNRANNLSSFNNNGVPESKRPSSIGEPNSAQHHQMVSKKPRFESRSSCPPFKVRKEKLGDRIVALQQLVAPFGKTDTASVLMEAIGYIKFLQNQVETLSVPYMKLSSRNKLNTNNTQRVGEEHIESKEQRPDLKSRGLCLVPLSCMTYLVSDACNGGLWPPPNYHPGFC